MNVEKIEQGFRKRMINADFEEKILRFYTKNIQNYKNAVAFVQILMYNKL